MQNEKQFIPLGSAVGGRGVPLPHQADDEGGTHWGVLRLAPGLWVRAVICA